MTPGHWWTWLWTEARHRAILLGYRVRPYDDRLDARRWAWQPAGVCSRQPAHLARWWAWWRRCDAADEPGWDWTPRCVLQRGHLSRHLTSGSRWFDAPGEGTP